MNTRWAAACLAAVLGLAVLYAGVRWGVLIAGGSDSYGYVSQAGLWQRGSLVVQEDVIRPSPWPLAANTWAPLGYRPSPNRPGAIVPIYAPGLPLLMALLQIVAGYCGAFLVVPLSGALTIWCTFLLGRRVFEAPGIALGGACLVATSPVFLYQLMNAMSDVPVTAAWALALVLIVGGRPLAAGLASSVAIAIRPNLLPLAFVPFVWTVMTSRTVVRVVEPGGGAREPVDRPPHGAHALWFVVGLVPAVAGIAGLNASLYENAWTSGYGRTGDYYALSFLWTNARQFARWMAEVETPIVALAGLYFLVPRLFPASRMPFARWLFGGTLAVVALSYLFYLPFGAWWYLRFLLPMWPVMMLLTVASLSAIVSSMGRVAPAVAAGLVLILAGHGLSVAARRHAFDLVNGERRYIDVARFVAGHTDADAVMLSVQHSGSLRIYADRLTLKYDTLDPAWLDRTVEYLQSIGRRPYFVLDGGEVDAFRQRFGALNSAGTLDWQPLARLGATVSIYDPIDRRALLPLPIARTRRPRGMLCDPPQSWPPVLRMK